MHTPRQAEDRPLASPKPPLALRVLMVALSGVLGLVTLELLAAHTRDHAFPYLNIYVPDAAFGVRLAPGASTATKSRQGRVSEVETNDLGFRGDAWLPAEGSGPVKGRVMLLGDSQVFGYGVDNQDAMAARLERALGEGHEVLNAGVPTWGPWEQVQALETYGPTYRPEIVVYVANVANDWFEVKLKNRERTTARDGWAAYVLRGQPEITDFPGRAWLMGRSHLVYSARALMSHLGGPPPQRAVSAQRLIDDLAHLSRPEGRYRSRLTAPLMATRARCRALGCRVIALGLPMDVQVHPSEWAKYASAPVDLGPTEVLLDHFIGEARHHGLLALDLRQPLLAASPGVFLPDDYHLSPAGHEVVAQALSELISPLSVRPPRLAHKEVSP